MLDSSERLDLLLRSVALVLVATIITYSIYPYLYSLFYTPASGITSSVPEGFTIESTPSGRVFKHVGLVKAEKEPEDDPWDSYFYILFFSSYSATYHIGFHGASTYSLSGAVTYHPTLNIVTQTRITVTFSFATTTTGSVHLCHLSDCGIRRAMYIPSRTWYPGYTYRWSITIPWYESSDTNIRASFVAVGAGTSTQLLQPTPLSDTTFYTECSYWSGGQLIYENISASAVSYTRTRINATHVYVTYSIAFPSSWVGRQVASCSYYSTDSSLISRINSAASNRQISGRIYFVIMSFNPNIVIETGDSVQLVIYYVAPANV